MYIYDFYDADMAQVAELVTQKNSCINLIEQKQHMKYGIYRERLQSKSRVIWYA